jgi:hypothetical protein
MRWTGLIGACVVALGVAAVPAVAAAPSLNAYVVQGEDMTGFTPKGEPTLYANLDELLRKAYQDTPAAYRKDKARLQPEGFRQALNQPLASVADPDGSAGQSFVMAFASGRGARAEARFAVKDGTNPEHYGKDVRIRRFRIAGVPGAIGWTNTTKAHEGGSANAVFTVGHCVFGVGDYVGSGSPATPVIAGVQALSKRANGTCP